MKRLTIPIAIALFAALAYLLGWSSVLTVKEYEVAGAPNAASQSLVERQAGIEIGDHLARIDRRAVSARLKEIGWVESISLSRDWIARKVTLTVIARTPIARLNSLYLSADGTIFDLPGGATSEVPVVSASSPRDGVEAAQFFRSLPQDFRSKVQTLRAESGIVTFNIIEGSRQISVRWGDTHENELKMRVFSALLARPENKKITSVDLSAPHAPIVR